MGGRVLKGFIGEDVVKVFQEYTLLMAKRSIPKTVGDQHITMYEPNIGHCIDIRFGDPLGDTLLLLCHKKVSEIINLKIEPITSCYRIYAEGCKLPEHKDNPDYEYSLTICMGYRSPECWPIFLKKEPAYLEPGDALLYEGAKDEHSRPIFKGSWHSQLFLHYKEVKDEKDGQTDS
jgi:hypothetical protein|tara:strand:- start:657 stop:1184 length:528 start_codon:yes stop_codon:yes gene_type:complete